MDNAVKKYFDAQPTLQREILEQIRLLIIENAPQAKEGMNYGVPSFKLVKNVLMYAAFKAHIGIYPEPQTIEFFKKDLVGYETSKGAIKFPLNKPIPYGLIKKIITYRYRLLIRDNMKK